MWGGGRRLLRWTSGLLLAAAGACALAAPAQRPRDPSPAPVAPDVFPFGVSWYPEWVPEATWDADLAMMRRANITYVRMAEFAWARMEPVEGRYDFGWLDRAIARAHAHGIRVMLGTPTAAPPAWLTTKYPEVLVVEADDRRAEHGGRRHASVSSRLYRQKSAAIAAEMGRRYGRNPAVIGFQIDNEYGRDTFDPQIKRDFQDWLRTKYGGIDHLNATWFNVYWSRDVQDWAQIGVPDAKYGNPPARLDWLRFVSEAWRDFQAVQIAALRPTLGPDKIITTNYVAKYDNFDFSVPAQDLDVVGWDQYHEQARLDPAESAMLNDMYRGFLGRNPWILEATPQNIVYTDRNFTPPKGQLRAQIWQAVAHGADSYSFWLWQTPKGGNEVLHGALVDTARRPKLTFDEIAQTGGEVARAWPGLRGGTPVADTAILHDYPNRWAIYREPLTVDYDPWAVFVRFHRAFGPATGGIDVLREARDLARYRMVVAPVLPMVDDAAIRTLDAYVQGGGHLVLGPRAGSRDDHLAAREPAAFDRLLGARADMGEVLSAATALGGPLGPASATIWAERLKEEAPGLEVLLRYAASDGWLDGAPAVVSRSVGRGRVTYVGALLDDAGLAKVARWAAERAGAKPLWPGMPAGVEVSARRNQGRTTYVAINWADAPARVALPKPMRNLLAGGVAAYVTLDRFGVAVFEERR